MHSRSSFLVASDGGVALFAEIFRAWDPSSIDTTPGYAQCPSHAWSEASKLDPAAPFPLSEFCARLVAAARTREIMDKMTLITRMANEGTEPAEAARRIGRSIAVHESMPFAVYALLTAPMSFEACLLCAVLNGGDRDTLGAMAGAISDAYLGIEAIPAEWRWKLENRVYLESLAARLAELRQPATK